MGQAGIESKRLNCDDAVFPVGFCATSSERRPTREPAINRRRLLALWWAGARVLEVQGVIGWHGFCDGQRVSRKDRLSHPTIYGDATRGAL
jgi:hypothetical protein